MRRRTHPDGVSPSGMLIRALRLRINVWTMALFVVALVIFNGIDLWRATTELDATRQVQAAVLLDHLAAMARAQSAFEIQKQVDQINGTLSSAEMRIHLARVGDLPTTDDMVLASRTIATSDDVRSDLQFLAPANPLRAARAEWIRLHTFHGFALFIGLILVTEFVLRLPLGSLGRAGRPDGDGLHGQVDTWIANQRELGATITRRRIDRDTREPIVHAVGLLEDIERTATHPLLLERIRSLRAHFASIRGRVNDAEKPPTEKED